MDKDLDKLYADLKKAVLHGRKSLKGKCREASYGNIPRLRFSGRVGKREAHYGDRNDFQDWFA